MILFISAVCLAFTTIFFDRLMFGANSKEREKSL